MSRRIWWLLLAAIVLCPVVARSETKTNGVTVGVRSGEKFNPAASGESTYVRRWVPRTLANGYTQNDSAVWVPPAERMPIPMTIGGVNRSDTTSQAVAMDASGNLKIVDADRDRDFSGVLTVLDATPLAAGATKGGTLAVNTASYSSIGIMLRWTYATAADSDSVNIVVKVFAKRSTAMDDGMNHLWTPRSGATAADTASFYTPVGLAGGRIPTTYYVTRNGTNGLKLNGTAQGYVYTIPLRQLRWAGNGGIYIPMSDCGIPFNAQYVGVEITNANISKALATVTAELWPRVN